MRLVWGTVRSVLGQEDGAQFLEVSLEDRSAPSDSGADSRTERALSFTTLAGTCRAGDRVLVNTTAVDLRLGTGSVHFVVARDDDGEGAAVDRPSGGHVMKLRYTPLQHDVMSVEEQQSPHHRVMREARSLEGLPVVCLGLHSQLAHAAAAVKATRSDLRVAYVMSDAGALPMAFSDLVRDCRAAGLLDLTVSAGQAFGGELEAVNLHSALLAATHVGAADVVIVSIGPGIVGTETPFGHGGVAQGEAINAAASLGGVPVAALRVSFADERPRHVAVSHHTLTALGSVALANARIAVPALDEEETRRVEEDLRSAGLPGRHRLEQASVSPATLPDLRGVEVRTMGRTAAMDPAFFTAAAAAGEVAARLVPGR